MDWDKLFLDNLPLIERVIDSVCRRKGCRGEEKEDFASVVRLKLMEDGYARLRKFKGPGKLSTYLTATVVNLFLDFRIEKWGKFRTSAAAQRLGWEAEALETLRVRDGFSDDEAIRKLQDDSGSRLSSQELEDLLARLPPRTPRRFTGEEELSSLGSDGEVEERLRDREQGARFEELAAALDRALRTIADEEERLILKMHFRDGFSWTAISKGLNLPRRQLYSRKDACLKSVREALKAEGWEWDEVCEVVNWGRGSAELEWIDEGR
jgi:RNA polymerase sigma factor for flagellar operon FliA